MGAAYGKQPHSLVVELDSSFAQFAPSAVLRLSYILPNLNFKASGAAVSVEGDLPEDLGALRRDILHAVYREKIYTETLPMRTAFFDAVTRR